MKFIDLKAQYRALKAEIDAGIQEVLDTAAFIGGPQIKELEQQLAAFVGRRNCIACGSGTDALMIAYMVAGIETGDAVFCPDMTFIASIEPANLLGATPVFCDIAMDTYNLCPDSLEKQIKAVIAEGKLTPKAVVAVDFLGNPAEFDIISDICKRYNLMLIEDAAQGFGASFHGRKCCSFGDIAITSFYPAKPLGCYGDGGAVFTDDDETAEICRSISTHGKGPKGKYHNVRVGMNSRLDTIQAAVLLPKLKAFTEYEFELRQHIAKRYNDAFGAKFVTPFVDENCVSSWAQYALLAETREQRDAIIAKLKENDIPTLIYYPSPQHALPVFKHLEHYEENFKNTDSYCDRTFSLPMHPYLEETEQQRVIDVVLEGIK